MLGIIIRYVLYGFLVLLSASSLTAQQASVEILVKDASSGEGLAFAAWQLEGSTQNGSSDVEGKIRIVNLRPGSYRILLIYLGYEDLQAEFEVQAAQNLKLTLKMQQAAFEMEQVVVSAQLDGQREAIQRQINADAIVNIVSKDRIEETPDQNAAETVGRIPGVSLQRDGGEATKVSIRGLSPRYNSITINGERIPSTDGNDRSVDLSMVSTDALDGIEVYKSITPDQDGDAVGGTVNFLIKKARRGLRGNFRGSTGYNQQQNEFGQYRGNFSLSNRFLDNKLGLILTGNYQQANRSSDELTASYITAGENAAGGALIRVEDVNLADQLETRKRYGGSLSLDYELKRGTITISSFLGTVDRDQLRYRTRYRPEQARKEIDWRERFTKQLTWNTTLGGEQSLGLWNSVLTYGASYARTDSDVKRDHTARFREDGAFAANIDESDIESIVAAAKNDLSRTIFQQEVIDNEQVNTQKVTGNIDWKIPFTSQNKAIEGFFKVGLKVRQQYRDRNTFRLWSAFNAINRVAAAFPDRYELNSDGRILLSPFLGDHDPGVFLNNRFSFGLGETLNGDAIRAFSAEHASDFYSEDERQRLQNYKSDEEVRAAYLMTKLTFFKRLTVIPGVRVENTRTNFEGLFGRSFEQEGQVRISAVDTVGTRRYEELLPMVQAKYQVKPWMDVRLSATKTLARPNFFDLVPWQQIDDIGRVVERGNANLQHTTAWNHDAFLSFYNQYGLLSFGGFTKRLNNVDYIRISRDGEPQSATRGYRLITKENLASEIKVVGAEIDLQSNLSFLPKPFNGVVFSINYTFLRSETLFPQLKIVNGPPPFFIPTAVDTFRSGVLPDQPDNVLNISMGYETGGFTARVSMVRQGSTLQFVGDRPELDGFFRAFTRWDFTMKQKFKKQMEIFVNINNISNTPEFVFLAADQRFPIREQYFGLTADLGVTYKFNKQ